MTTTEPLDLDEIEQTYRHALNESMMIGTNTMKAFQAVPQLVAELRELRGRIGGLEK